MLGAAQAVLLWFAVWLGWQYTCWMANWFDPDARSIRLMLFVQMGMALLLAAALPQAFGERGLVFARCYALMQIGRALYLRLQLGVHPLGANLSRILGWACVCSTLWVCGGLADGTARMALSAATRRANGLSKLSIWSNAARCLSSLRWVNRSW